MKIRAHLIALLGALVVTLFLFPETVAAQQQVKPDKGKAKKALADGDKFLRERNYREALAKFSEAVRFDPTNSTAHFNKGYSHYFLKEYDDALAELNIAQQQKYKLFDIQRIRSYVQYERKDYDAAMIDLRGILAVEPNNMEYLRLHGVVSLGQKNYDEALGTYQKISSASPQDGNVFYVLAQIYAGKGDLENQAAAAENAMQKGTRFHAEAQALAADAYMKLGRTQQAETALLKVLEAKPDNRPIYSTLADMYRQQSRFNDAIEILRRAIRLYPTDGGLFTDVSWYYSLAGRHEDAIQAAHAGIRYLPDQYMAYTNLCRAYNDVNKPELAISSCNNALKLKPDDGETYFYLGRANDILNRPAEATKFYKRAVTGLESFTAQNPNYSDGFYLLGNAYFADGQFDKAIAAYSKNLEMSPRFARARYNIGMVQLQKRNKPGATEQYNILVDLDKSLATKLKTEIDKAPDKP